MKLPRKISLIFLAFGSILPISAEKLNFDNINLDQLKDEQNTYQPKDKLDK